jgi:antirestriction protein ArdC
MTTTTTTTTRTMAARFASECAQCSGPIAKGAEILYLPDRKCAVHPACFDPDNLPESAAVDRVAETQSIVVDAIVASIESGLADPAGWRAPWHDTVAGLPVNVATGATYQGGNLFYLWSLVAHGASRYWGTMTQWNGLSTKGNRVHVRKGEGARGVWLLRPREVTLTDEATGEKSTRLVGWRAYQVWHGGQVVGWSEPADATRPTLPGNERDDIDAAFRFAALTGATVRESEREGAYYSPTLDYVSVPSRERWADGHGCWSTLAHELTHWTGHDKRLARTFGKRFGDDEYAAEELCAELGAAFTLAAVGRSTEPRPDHAQYLAHWLRVLKADPAALWVIAGRASKAAEYLTDRAVRPAPELATA